MSKEVITKEGLIFSFIEGSHTINIAAESDPEKEIDCISFDYEKSETTYGRAEKVIDQYLKENN